MKRKNLLISLLALACVATSGAAFVACGDSSEAKQSNEIEQVYAQYVTYKEAQGETPLSYETWLLSIKGEKGDKGATGENGKSAYEIWLAFGNRGTEGDFLESLIGKQGEKGDKGATGENGKSAYQIWLELGNMGSESDFIASLKGEKGDTGEQGASGGQGTTEGHIHTFADWIDFSGEEVSCEQRLYYHACNDCHIVEWKQGTASDHDWKRSYSCNSSFHWIACKKCDTVQEYAEHTPDDSGYCTVCDQPLLPSDGIVYDVSADGTYAEVISYEGSATRVLIADTYNNLPVKNIYDEAFYDNDTITSVVIPEGVASIGVNAFYSCDNLTDVEMPDSVTFIGDSAFENGDYLTNINMPDNLVSIGNRAFANCWQLTEVNIPNGVISIGMSAFNTCYNLTSVTLPESLLYIDCSSFASCRELQFNIYGNAKYLGNENNPYLVLTEVVNTNYSSYQIHSQTKVIASRVFEQCNRMTSITVPESIKVIGYSAFLLCESLTNVTFENTNGWTAEFEGMYESQAISSTELANVSTAASYLTEEYYYYYWKRS